MNWWKHSLRCKQLQLCKELAVTGLIGQIYLATAVHSSSKRTRQVYNWGQKSVSKQMRLCALQVGIPKCHHIMTQRHPEDCAQLLAEMLDVVNSGIFFNTCKRLPMAFAGCSA